MTVSTARAEARSHTAGRLSLGSAAALVAAAVIAGLLIGGVLLRTPRPAAKPTEVAGAGIRVQLPAGWQSGGVTGLAGFERALWLRKSGDDLRAAVALLPAASPTLLPATLPADGASPEKVRLKSGYEAWRYRLARGGSAPLFVYVTPTTGGIATVACLGGACDALASAVAVPDARRLELSKRAALFSAAPSVVARLQAARAKGASALEAAAAPAAQASAADTLASAHRTAASNLSAVSIPGEPLPGALTATAEAYAGLARAARARIPGPYADAGRAVEGADTDLRHTLAKVAADADAAIATRARTPAPAATKAPASEPIAATGPAPAKPGGGLDLTFPLLALLAAVTGVFAVRQALRE